MSAPPRPLRELLLLGGGHAQLAVLRALARQRAAAGWRVTLVTPRPLSLYSGMLPGWMAGHYRLEQCGIDLRPLALAAGAQLELGEAVGLDAAQRQVRLADGRALPYDLLSLDIGSGIALGALGGPNRRGEPRQSALPVLPVRPLAAFVPGWQAIVEQAGGRADFRLVVLGAGAGGVELAFAARQRLGCEVALVGGPDGLLPGHAAAVRVLARRWLQRRGIALHSGPAQPADGGYALPGGTRLAADAALAATGAQAAGWLAASGLALAGCGRVLVDAQHRSASHPEVFAAGDTCQRGDGALAASGVHAVRAGPVLAHNLAATMHGHALIGWQPRASTLYLLATGPRHALMSWGAFAAAGGWVWRWKDHIDRAFIARHDARQAAAPP